MARRGRTIKFKDFALLKLGYTAETMVREARTVICDTYNSALPQMMMTMMWVPQQELPQLQMIGRQRSCRREAEAACLAEWSPRCCDDWP